MSKFTQHDTAPEDIATGFGEILPGDSRYSDYHSTDYLGRPLSQIGETMYRAYLHLLAPNAENKSFCGAEDCRLTEDIRQFNCCDCLEKFIDWVRSEFTERINAMPNCANIVLSILGATNAISDFLPSLNPFDSLLIFFV